MVLTLLLVGVFVFAIVRALMRPTPTKWKRIKNHSRVRWLPEEIDVPDDGE
jgi:hypothetical protein